MATEKPKASVEKITELALAIVKEYVSKETETVIGVKEKEGKWKVTVEALERKRNKSI